MLKQGGQWKTVDWQTALEYVANGLKQIKADHGAASIGTLASPHSTLEELYLAASLMRGMGSDNIDYRLRHAEFAPAIGVRWLGTSIVSLSALQRVLIVGAASGYSTAVLKLLAGRVTALESDIALIAMARSNGIAIVDGPLVDGYAADAPYDLILVDGAVAIVPEVLLRQLAPGGRLAAVVVGDDGVGRVTVGSYAAGHFAATSFIEAGVRLLPGFARAAQFVF